MKLNLGCYSKKLPGFINVDIRDEANPDVIDDAFKLSSFEKYAGNIDIIYCSHMLEHLNARDAMAALKRWYYLLRDGGTLRLAVPDMEAVFAHYFYWKDFRVLKSALWGSQKHNFDYHKAGWVFDTLKEDLLSVGFNEVKKWSPELTYPHNYIDDYSQAYYPDGAKKTVLANGKTVDLGGKLMSLNVEGYKNANSL